MPSAALRRAAASLQLEQRADLGVGEVGEVAVDDGAPLLRRQRREGAVQLRVGRLRALVAGRPASRGARPAGPAPGPPGADLVDRLVVGDRHQPAPDVAVRPQVGVGPQGGQERLRPGVVGVDRAEQGAADPHHHRAVLGHDRFERLHRHTWSTNDEPDPVRSAAHLAPRG